MTFIESPTRKESARIYLIIVKQTNCKYILILIQISSAHSTGCDRQFCLLSHVCTYQINKNTDILGTLLPGHCKFGECDAGGV